MQNILNFGDLLINATIHFVLGAIFGIFLSWRFIAKIKHDNHAEMLNILKQKDEIIKQKDADLDRKNKENDIASSIFANALAEQEATINTLIKKFQSKNDTQPNAKH